MVCLDPTGVFHPYDQAFASSVFQQRVAINARMLHAQQPMILLNPYELPCLFVKAVDPLLIVAYLNVKQFFSFKKNHKIQCLFGHVYSNKYFVKTGNGTKPS
jgi:hypothetical protein